ncbi:NADH-quinone oxidoreductase subunit N [Halovenus aranensis]|uniref:NADH-quinone oxidoreductase subunit N n=1 Tax=Halovenus aranensis TaxID=890420 RepID=A0A1G8UCI2_9EURY|nr:NADH-quinone oxidoreductase subunit N [Halovenus aranensis]SDJ51461.1 NADH-quinone oxidoreductase subunit N [Halovenus aranensis]
MTDFGTLPDWAALGPALALGFTALALFVADMVYPKRPQRELFAGISVTGGLAGLALSVWYLVAGTGQAESGGAIQLFEGTLVVDGMSLFFATIVTSVVVLVTLASYDYLVDHPHQAEIYSLTLLAATGMVMVGMSNSFVTAFIAIELSSLPSYALVASLKENRGSIEGGLKYFLIGALSSAILAYGISLVYVSTGSLQFGAVTEALSGGVGGILGLGIVMILAGFGFKIAAVPFHFWAPEAYEGAPGPVSAFISSASKAAGFVILFRVFVDVFPYEVVEGTVDWVMAFQAIAIVTMTVANFAALRQEKVKRMLAYSSVGHAGYVLIAVAALTGEASGAFVLGSGMVHLMVYAFMNTGAFLFIALAEHWGIGRRIEDFNGLATQAPFACGAMTLFLLSLAGLPIGGGFFSKLYLLIASVRADVALLAVALVLNSVVSLFYYTRVIKAMWVEDPSDDLEIESQPVGLYTALALAALVTVLLLPGFGIAVEFANTAAKLVVP